MKISTAERRYIADLSIDDLVNYSRDFGLPAIGAASRFLLDEFSRRLGVDANEMALVMVRPATKADPDNTVRLYHWALFSEERRDLCRELPTRSWNATTKSNCFTPEQGRLPDMLEALTPICRKMMVISGNGYSIMEGTAGPSQPEALLYDLLDDPWPVDLAAILDAYQAFRPDDVPVSLAIHGEIDPEYRSLFGGRLKPDALASLSFETRHNLLLFHVPITNGRPRYLVYDPTWETEPALYYADNRDTRQILAMFKEAQRKLGHPLIERDPALIARLARLEPGVSGFFPQP